MAIIPARGGSKGIPLKNLKSINRKPLIEYSINSSLKSKFITRTIVSSDHTKILKTAAAYEQQIKVKDFKPYDGFKNKRQ